MNQTLLRYIDRECTKLVRRFHLKVARDKRIQKRYSKRTGQAAGTPASLEPHHWSLHPQFNPFKVRSRKDVYAHALAKRIRDQTYVPQPCLIQHIPKVTGGTRPITVFSVPDAAIASYLFDRLLKRNGHLFSTHAYAYRADRNAHHAIQHLSAFVRGSRRKFVLEYDFKNYFGSISHEYLFNVLDSFKVSPREKVLIQSFLKCPQADGAEAYQNGTHTCPEVGIPQGNSLSLFLANVACFELDRKIEQTGATFGRYADDTVIICETYDQAHRCADLMLCHEKQSHTPINTEKSDGLSLLSTEKHGEITTKRSFDFLGHEISQAAVRISRRSVRRIKRKISTIVFRHLLYYPRRGSLGDKRIDGTVDWDVVTCLNEIRCYLYGQVSEKTVSQCLADKTVPLEFTFGLLSFYPLVDDPEVFRELDGWLLSALSRAQMQRRKDIKKWKPDYKAYSKSEWITGTWYVSELDVEPQVPSFFKAWQYVRRCLNVYGLQKFPAPRYES